jgi:hypothetical protein
MYAWDARKYSKEGVEINGGGLEMNLQKFIPRCTNMAIYAETLKQCVAIDVQVERMQKFEFIRHYAK